MAPTNLFSGAQGADPGLNQFGLGTGSSSALTGDASKVPFVGGLFPDPRQAEMQRVMQAMANDYARQRLVNQQQREAALRQQLAYFNPANDQLGAMYAGKNQSPSAMSPESLFGSK